jgi:fucose 4-O-acetylase-like acetyltransferase
MHHPAETESGALNGTSEPAPAGQTGRRDLLFDAMKGFGIILVILGHALQSGSPQADENFAFRMIYSFHMPLFFFISGYVLQINLEGKPLAPFSFILKKARALVLPFLSWYLIFGLWRGLPSDVTLSQYLQRIVLSPAYGYWFLWVLFLCFVAFLPLAWLQQRVDARWRPALIGLSFVTFYLLRCTSTGMWGLGMLKVHYFYFAAGFFIGCWRKQLSLLNRWWPEICIVGFLLLVPYWKRVGELPFQPFLKAHFPIFEWPGTYAFGFLVGLLGIGSVVRIVKPLLSAPAGRWLAWVGYYTLDIYVIHLYVIPYAPFAEIFRQRIDTFSLAVVVAWGLFASLGISLLFIRRSVILKLLFLGILDARKTIPADPGRKFQTLEPALSGGQCGETLSETLPA